MVFGAERDYTAVSLSGNKRLIMVASSVKKHAPFKLGMGKKLFRVTALPSLPARHFQKFSGRFRFDDRLPHAHFTESHVISFTYAGRGRTCDSTLPYPSDPIRGCLKLRMRLVLPLVAENCKVQESEPLNQV